MAEVQKFSAGSNKQSAILALTRYRIDYHHILVAGFRLTWWLGGTSARVGQIPGSAGFGVPVTYEARAAIHGVL
jgi:hypothetical protein